MEIRAFAIARHRDQRIVISGTHGPPRFNALGEALDDGELKAGTPEGSFREARACLIS